ncbi:hypothetical protein ACRS3X_00895 [Ectopseudomonas hydrolytica]|uniref:hypothetical protein n=1 Tax=Ectopseudomonas hydrolytica TaxID=2493633 RepID=UPI003EE3D640
MSTYTNHRSHEGIAMTPSTVMQVSPRKHWTVRHGTRITNHATRRLRAYPSAGSAENDRAFKDERLQTHSGGRISAAGAANRLYAPKCANWVSVERDENLGKAAFGGSKQQHASGNLVVDTGGNWRYGSPVAVSSAADLGRSNTTRRYSAHTSIAGAFFVPAMLCYGGCAWDAFGRAGFRVSRSANPRTAVTIPCLAASGDGSDNTHGAPPMNNLHAPNPSASHAAAWKARALAALHSDSSLSVRLRRYNQAMARARALEAQEVTHV